MKLSSKLSLIFFTHVSLFTTAIYAEEPTPTPEAKHESTNTFEEVFKTVLGDTDYFVCESNIQVSITRTGGNLPANEEVFFAKLDKRGKDGHQTLKDLETELHAAKSKALERCRKENTEQECLTKGLINNQSIYTELDFKSRKAFLETLTKSCSENKVDCKTANSSPPDCFVSKFHPATSTAKEAAPTAEPAKAPAKK